MKKSDIKYHDDKHRRSLEKTGYEFVKSKTKSDEYKLTEEQYYHNLDSGYIEW